MTYGSVSIVLNGLWRTKRMVFRGVITMLETALDDQVVYRVQSVRPAGTPESVIAVTTDRLTIEAVLRSNQSLTLRLCRLRLE